MQPMTDYAICGWYTPDYAHWKDRLVANLEGLGLEGDFVEVERPAAGWEKITMLKAAQVLAAMDRHPGKTVIFLDVDCLVVNKDKLLELANIEGDVGFYLRTKFRRNGGIRWATRSGTLVIRPTQAARQFIEAWRRLSDAAPGYSVDQDSLAVAMGKSPVSMTFLDVRYCAVPSDNLPDPWVFHDSASKGVRKVKKIERLFARLFRKRINHSGLDAAAFSHSD